jgi:DNA polymerase III delta subunit
MAKKAARKKSTKAKDPHPEQGLLALTTALKEGLPRGVILRGEERYFRERAIDQLVRAGADAGLEVTRHDSADPDFKLAMLMDDLAGGALFAAGRMVVVRGADALVQKGARKFSAALLEAAKAYVARAEPGALVLAADKLRADHVMVKAVNAIGAPVVSCRKLWDTPPPWDDDPRKTELVQWLVSRARALKIPLQPDEAVYVAAAIGNDLAAIENQLEQLRGRGAEGVRSLVGWDSGGSPYVVADRLCEGETARAIAGVEALFQSGFSGSTGTRTVERPALVAMLASALSSKARESLAGARTLAAGGSPADAWSDAGGRGGPMAQKAFAGRLGRRTPQGWARLARAAGDLERRSRSGATVDANDFCSLAVRFGSLPKPAQRAR